ncbi:MAG: 4Fe-4S dicluster domain-containing protein [Phycisphaerales bacterium]|nr:4Fe-4S dicluster domain-containing protein [Phycisphaerales bacterium]
MSTDDAGRMRTLAQACIHCGLCLEDCPTYLELGNELDSPRGRILLMRRTAESAAPADEATRRHVELCLGCRACEAACPSGVRYGELLEHFRATLHEAPREDRQRERRDAGANQSGAGSTAAAPARRRRTLADRLTDLLIFHVTPYPRRLALAVALGRWSRAIGLTALAARLIPGMQKLLRMLPADAGRPARLPATLRARGAARDTVVVFAGCAPPVLTPRSVQRALRVLAHNGATVECPSGLQCCGAIHAHSGRLETARAFARRNIAVLDSAESAERTIVTMAAGCGAMLRGYGALLVDDDIWAKRAARVASRVRDISEYLVELGPVPPTRSIPRAVCVHDACHLVHVQRVQSAPRRLLSMIPGLNLREAPEAAVCCGAAGSYNLTQPETAERLAQRKLRNLASSGATCAATGNIGCILHLNAVHDAGRPPSADAGDAGAPFVLHTIDLLHEAYGLADR